MQKVYRPFEEVVVGLVWNKLGLGWYDTIISPHMFNLCAMTDMSAGNVTNFHSNLGCNNSCTWKVFVYGNI